MKFYNQFVVPVVVFISECGNALVASTNKKEIATNLRPGSSMVLVAWFAGTCIPIIQAELWPAYALLLLALSFALLSVRVKPFLVVCALAAGLLWVSISFYQHSQNILPENLEGVDIEIQGQVIGLPSTTQENIKFQFLIENASSARVIERQKLQLSCYRCPLDIIADQHWLLTVRLKRPHGYASWGAFDYEKYLFRHQIVAKGYVRIKDRNLLIENSGGSVNHWRELLRARITASTSTDEGVQNSGVGRAIMAALVIGDKSGLSKEQRETFQVTGISHLMAISGLHVGLVFASLTFLLRFLFWPIGGIYEYVPRPWLIMPFALSGAFLYSALAGFAVSTQRALVMLCVYVFCRLIIREVSLLKVLLVAICLITLIDPYSVLDAGFWLSCGAVFVIAISVGSYESSSLIKLQPKLWLGMLPLTSLLFGQVSLASPLVNLLMVPLFCLLLIPLTLVSVALSVVGLDSIGIPLISLLDWVYREQYVALNWIAKLPFAMSTTPAWRSTHWFILFLVVLTLGLSRWRQSKRYTLLHAASWLLLVIAIVVPQPVQNKEETRVSLLDVGQGLSMVVEISDYVLVYDTGPKYSSGFSAAEAVLLPYLRSRGISKIDTLIISHADNDHIGGFETIAGAMKIGEVLTSRVDKIPTGRECVAGYKWRVGGALFEIMSPYAATPNGSNNRSCVLLLQQSDTRVLITGDIEKQVERDLVSRGVKLKADIMLVPHQGSKTSSTPEFIDAVNPELALIAAGYRNHYGHPHESVVQRYQKRGIDLVSTADNGSVLLKINKDGWARESFRVVKRRFWHHQKVPNWD